MFDSLANTIEDHSSVEVNECVIFCKRLIPHVHTMLMMQWKSHRRVVFEIGVVATSGFNLSPISRCDFHCVIGIVRT
jgi:hypothetical protein